MLTDVRSIDEAELDSGQYDRPSHNGTEDDKPGRALPLLVQS
jgi:hypothetical protein